MSRDEWIFKKITAFISNPNLIERSISGFGHRERLKNKAVLIKKIKKHLNAIFMSLNDFDISFRQNFGCIFEKKKE